MSGPRLTDSFADHFPAALVHWAEGFQLSEHDEKAVHRAFRAFDIAMFEALAYLDERGKSSSRDQERRETLAVLWTAASRAVAPIDPGFSDKMIALGWGEVSYWSTLKMHVSDVRKARIILSSKESGKEPDFNPAFVGSGAHIRASSSVLITLLVLVGIFGFACIYGGLHLMAAPGAGNTSFNFLGLQFSTQQAGVASIALGAVTIILTFRKVLKTIVDLGRI